MSEVIEGTIVEETIPEETLEPSRWSRIKTWCKNHPAIVGVSIGAATTALALALQRRAEGQENETEEVEAPLDELDEPSIS